MFEDFALRRANVGEAELRVRTGGEGPPVLLLHGHPRTHTTWHRVAPQLARTHTVVCPDLRGYGQSSKPGDYSKRAMARDCVALMKDFDRFIVVGHDRGGGVATRLAMDHPERVEKLVALDIVPIGAALQRADATFAKRWYHWFFLAQDELAAAMINADPDVWYRGRYGRSDTPAQMGVDNWADYQRAIHDPATVRAMCGDYRAGLEVDGPLDLEDLAAGRRITCPVLALWARRDDLGELYGDVLAVWREWAGDVRGRSIDCGHHIAEEAPDELVRELLKFV
jgi:haloacetate dehalogenase